MLLELCDLARVPRMVWVYDSYCPRPPPSLLIEALPTLLGNCPVLWVAHEGLRTAAILHPLSWVELGQLVVPRVNFFTTLRSFEMDVFFIDSFGLVLGG
jgi:hypothetical protein